MARRANDNGLLRLATGASEFAARIRMTEIDDNVAAVDLFRDVVTEIQTGGYLDVCFRRRRRDRLAHPAFRAEQ